MHRQIRLMLAEDNLPEQERIFYEMLEDIRECAMCGADAGKILEKWEQWYLSKKIIAYRKEGGEQGGWKRV